MGASNSPASFRVDLTISAPALGPSGKRTPKYCTRNFQGHVVVGAGSARKVHGWKSQAFRPYTIRSKSVEVGAVFLEARIHHLVTGAYSS
jgi:hypothetical protein